MQSKKVFGAIAVIIVFLSLGLFLGDSAVAYDDEAGSADSTGKVDIGGYFYMVRSDDTLGHIAKKELGSFSFFRRISEANGIEPPYLIKPGQVLFIPVPNPIKGMEVAKEAKSSEVTERNLEVKSAGRWPKPEIEIEIEMRNWPLTMIVLVYVLFSFFFFRFLKIKRELGYGIKIPSLIALLFILIEAEPDPVSTGATGIDIFGGGYEVIGDMDYTLMPWPGVIEKQRGEEDPDLVKKFGLREKFLRVSHAEAGEEEVMPRWLWQWKVLSYRNKLIPAREREEMCKAFERYYGPYYKYPRYKEHILEACRKLGIPPWLTDVIIWRESDGDETEVSPKGAKGMMQIMPDTAKLFGIDPDTLFDPEVNIRFGTWYFVHLYNNKFAGDIVAALAGYNCGFGRVLKEGIPNEVRRDFVIPILSKVDKTLSEIMKTKEKRDEDRLIIAEFRT